MKLFETLFGVAFAAAVVPYKVKVEKTSEEENAPKKVSVESLVYRVDVTPKETDGVVARDVSLTIPAEGIRRICRFAKDKFIVIRDKAGDAKDKVTDTARGVKDKVTDTVADIRARRATKKAAATPSDASPVIEVDVEDDENA